MNGKEYILYRSTSIAEQRISSPKLQQPSCTADSPSNHWRKSYVFASQCEFEDRKMLDSPQHDYRYTELDPDLLSMPFSVQTNWHVITGAPCCGKTTLIDLLANKGFQTVPETAHLYIEREISKGRTFNEILGDRVSLQWILIDMQLIVEHELHANDVTFLDRALPDSLAFNRFFGLNPNEILLECFHYRYASTIVMLPYSYSTHFLFKRTALGTMTQPR